LRAVKRVTDGIIVGRGAELTFELKDVRARADSRQSDRFAVALSQLTRAAKIAFARFVFGETEPRVGQPIAMLLNISRKFFGVATLRPISKERELFRFGEGFQIGIVLQNLCQCAFEFVSFNSREIWESEVVTTHRQLGENSIQLAISKRCLGKHA
jgi:hypothetical protein